MVVFGSDLLARLFMAEAVISRPGPQEPEKGHPGPDEDNRSAKRGQSVTYPNEINRSRARKMSIRLEPEMGLSVVIPRGY